MDPLSIALMGGTALGSYFSGQSSAKAAREAAQRQSDAEERAAIRTRNAGDAYRSELRGYGAEFNPYIEGGQRATNRLYDLVGLNGPGAAESAFMSSPGYQHRLDSGLQALDRSAAARGYLNSGRNQMDTIKFAQGEAANDFNDQFNRLSTLGNQGYAATGARTGLESTGSLGNLNANLTAEQMMFKNAGTVPAGMIAGANAEARGLEGALGALNYGAGRMGSSFGMPSFGGQNPLQSILNNRQSSYASAAGLPIGPTGFVMGGA